MGRLFARHFLTPTAEPDQEPPQLVYDEGRSLNLDASGRVAVELVRRSGTDTLTEVRGEHEDPEPEEDLIGALGTTTKVNGEAEDPLFSEAALGTDTKRGAENEDRLRAEFELGTRTSVPGEPEDFIADGALDTDTRNAPEAEDFLREEPWAGTETFMDGEAEDFARDVLDAGLGAERLPRRR